MTTFATGSLAPRQDLQVAVMEGQIEEKFIATEVFPPLPVQLPEGVYGQIPIESLRQDVDVKRGADGTYNQLTVEYESGSFECTEYGLEMRADSVKARRFATWFDYEASLARICTMAVLRAQEARVVALLHDTTNFTGASNYLDVSTVWSNSAADIIGDIATGRQAIFDKTGGSISPDNLFLAVGEKGHDWISKNDDVREQVKYVERRGAEIPLSELAGALNVGVVIKGTACKNSADKGQAYSNSRIWSDSYAFLGVRNTGFDPDLPAIGRTLYWEEEGGLLTTESYSRDDNRSEMVRTRQFVQNFRTSTLFGFLFKID